MSPQLRSSAAPQLRTLPPQLPTLCVDLDGVIVELQSGPYDPGAPLAPCLPGAREAINALADQYTIVVLTARENGCEYHLGILAELLDRGLRISEVTNVKPPAVAYLDDLALTFISWSLVPELLRNLCELRGAMEGLLMLQAERRAGGGLMSATLARTDPLVGRDSCPDAVAVPPLSSGEGAGGEANVLTSGVPHPALAACNFISELFAAHRDLGLRIEELWAYHAPTRSQIVIYAIRHTTEPDTAEPYLYHVRIQQIEPYQTLAHGHTVDGDTIHWVPLSAVAEPSAPAVEEARP